MQVGKDNTRSYELAFGQMDDDESKTIECVSCIDYVHRTMV